MIAPDHATQRFETILREQGHPYMVISTLATLILTVGTFILAKRLVSAKEGA
jgi:hypothetical protein